MVKRCLVVLLLLALPALANVAQDDGTVQIGDPDGPGSTAPVAQPSGMSPGQLPLPVDSTPSETTGGSGAERPEGIGTSGEVGPDGRPSRLGPDGEEFSREDLRRQLDEPMPMENPYSLLAVGVLLLLLALIGGLYFYRNRDREEPGT